MRQVRLKDLGRWYSGGTPPRDSAELWEGDVPWISAKDFDDGVLVEPTAFITRDAAERHSRLVPRDAILIIVRGMALAHGLPVALTGREVAFNQDVRGLVCAPSVHPRFALYGLLGHRGRLDRHIDRAAHGTARVTDSVYSERISVPAIREQISIVEFLDLEYERINGLRHVLQEHKETSVQLEGRILDDLFADAPMIRLGWLARVQTGLTLGGTYEDRDLVERPYLRVANVHADEITTADVATVRVPSDIAARATLRSGDVLMTEGGDIDKLGRGAVWDGRVDGCLHQNHVFAVRCGERLEPDLLAMWTRSSAARSYFERTASRITNIASTNLTKLLRLPVPDLPMADQLRALERFERERSQIMRLRTETEGLTRRIAEYRDALITEAVTGKFDVTRLSEQQLDDSARAAMEREQPEVLAG